MLLFYLPLVHMDQHTFGILSLDPCLPNNLHARFFHIYRKVAIALLGLWLDLSDICRLLLFMMLSWHQIRFLVWLGCISLIILNFDFVMFRCYVLVDLFLTLIFVTLFSFVFVAWSILSYLQYWERYMFLTPVLIWRDCIKINKKLIITFIVWLILTKHRN